MNILERYIFRRAGIATLAVLTSLGGVVWIVQALGNVDVITSKGQTLLTYFAVTTLVIPMLFLAVIPVALLLATVYTVNVLNGNSELVVINASGASNRLIVKPFLILALLAALFTGFVGHFVMAWSLTALKSYTTQMNADLVTLLVREGEFNQIEKGLTFHVAKRMADGRLGGILIADERDTNASMLYTAREGFITRAAGEALMILRQGEIHQTDRKDGTISVIRYDSYAFDLSSFAPKEKSSAIRPKERSTLELFSPDPDDKFYKEKPQLYAFEIHQRFSEMLWPFAYVTVMLAFCGQARSSRQGYGSAIAAGMTLLLFFRGVAFVSQNGIKNDESAAAVVYFIPILLIAVASVYLYHNQPVSMPRFLQPKLDQLSAAMGRNLETLRLRYIRFRRRQAGVAS